MEKILVVRLIEIDPQATEKAANFDIRIKKSEAERLLTDFGYSLPFAIMCKEYGDDADWVGLTPEDIDEETGLLHESYQTFEIWFN